MIFWTPQIGVCPPEDREAALEVLYQRVPVSLRSHLIAEVLSEAASGQIDLSGLWIAREAAWTHRSGCPHGRIIGSLMTRR